MVHWCKEEKKIYTHTSLQTEVSEYQSIVPYVDKKNNNSMAFGDIDTHR